jgi:hypothetical protein
MEWTSSAVHIWFFPPNGIPASLTSAASYSPTYSHPDTSAFGIPSASFAGPCSNSFRNKFFNHTIVLNTNFCGGWASGSFGKGDATQCSLLEGITPEESCRNFVASHPKAFEEAYWGIRSLRVWQKSEEVKSSVLVNYVNYEMPDGLLLPVATPIATPSSAASVASILVEDTPTADPSWIASLTGGLLNAGLNIDDTFQRQDPVPIDSGIGDGTFSAPFKGPSGLFDTSPPESIVLVSAVLELYPKSLLRGSPLYPTAMDQSHRRSLQSNLPFQSRPYLMMVRRARFKLWQTPSECLLLLHLQKLFLVFQ